MVSLVHAHDTAWGGTGGSSHLVDETDHFRCLDQAAKKMEMTTVNDRSEVSRRGKQDLGGQAKMIGNRPEIPLGRDVTSC